MPCFVIAEIGVNHQGDMSRVGQLILDAKKAGADACKFQLFRNRPEIEHLRLDEAQMKSAAGICAMIGIEFMCTPFHLEAVAFLDPLVKRHKVASGFLTDKAMLDAVCATGKPVILSTGMSEYKDVMKAIRARNKLSILHCVSSYPCPDNEANLGALRWRYTQNFPIGYSDHTEGTLACIAAVALGAQIIEKHLTFDKKAQGPDHKCSAEPEEFADMVRQIRRVEKMLGDGIKRIMPSEEACAKVWR